MSPTPHSTAFTHSPGRTVAFQPPGGAAHAGSGTASVEIVVPVHNEERALPGCLRTLHTRLTEGHRDF
ncbi:hypothetical protein [Streptomyces guryensis]|uniref:Glycosyl transferase family 2 n=1 Tax=Streptomyces guryensis TaxID=2886947 RepID=A0A9Q3VYG7_9ACTN|nr:hypothetical protein [Streptomyces guryensis]MCD9879280.1 hypothetical protein [Streptomyces guryensis]